MRSAGWCIRSEQAFVQWIRRFILFHGKRHPRDMAGEELTAFLSHLASQRNVAASTQNQALNAILFLCRDVLKIKLPWSGDVQRRQEAPALASGADPPLLPQNLTDPLRMHLAPVRTLHEQDLRAGFGRVHLPFALATKYPNADRQWEWQYVSPSSRRSTDPRSGAQRRLHAPEDALQRALKLAARKAAFVKPATVYDHNPAARDVRCPCIARRDTAQHSQQIRRRHLAKRTSTEAQKDVDLETMQGLVAVL